jgi:hypothetical protein
MYLFYIANTRIILAEPDRHAVLIWHFVISLCASLFKLQSFVPEASEF